MAKTSPKLIHNRKHRSSSFSSPSSPWARRKSFLSPSMINDEKHTIYELSSSYSSSDDDGPILSFSLSLKESQGFSWNQDLFASEYQQSRANDDDDQSEDDKETLVQDNIKVIHQKRRHSANNSRDGYNCVEVSEIIVDDDGFEE